MSKPTPQAPKAVQDCHDLLAWLIPQLDKFPRNRRFTLGERIESKVIHILECLVSATYSAKRSVYLSDANLQLEVVRHLWRVAFELKVIAMKSWEYGAQLMLELGRQLGGWLKGSKI